jgi:hypothetical protein
MTRIVRTAYRNKRPRATNKDRQDEALWLVHRLNAKKAVATQSEQRGNADLALVGIVLSLLALAGLMVWAAWQ